MKTDMYETQSLSKKRKKNPMENMLNICRAGNETKNPERMANFRSIHLETRGKTMEKKKHRNFFSFQCHMTHDIIIC